MNDYKRIEELKENTLSIFENEIEIEDLYLKDQNGQTYFEYIIQEKLTIYSTKILKHISRNYNLLLYTINHNYILNEYYDSDLLLQKENGITLIEKLYKIDPFKCAQALPTYAIYKLFEKENGEYLIEKLLKTSENISQIIPKVNDPQLLYNCLSEIGRLDLMENANEYCLTYITQNGKTLLETIEQAYPNFRLNYETKNSEKIAEILYKTKQYDKLLNTNIELLLNSPNQNNNYLNLLIEKYKNGENINFENLTLYQNNNAVATANILLLKNNIEFEKTASYNLFSTSIFSNSKPEKPLFIRMYEIDKDITIKYFYNKEIEQKLKEYLAQINGIPVTSLKEIDINNLEKYLVPKVSIINQIKNNQIKIEDLTTEELLSKIDGNITVLEYLIKNNITPSYQYDICKYFDGILTLVKYNQNIFSGTNEEFLYKDVGNNQKLIDLLMQNKKFNICINQTVKRDLRIMDYCIKYNRYDVLNAKIISELFMHPNELEKYLNNDQFLEAVNLDQITQINKLLEYFDKGHKKLLLNADEEIQLKVRNGKTVLESLLESNLTPKFKGGITSQKTLEILVKYNRFDLVSLAKLELLMNYPNKETNYLSYLIEATKKKMDVHLEKISCKIEDNELKARLYIQMAKSDLQESLDTLEEKDLLKVDKDRKNLLYYLIQTDKETTLNKILSTTLKSNPNVFTELKLLGITDTPINISYKSFNCDEMSRTIANEKYCDGIITTPTVEPLLQELRELFLNDGQSDKDLIEALVTSYRYTTSVNPIFIEELKLLIEIKKKNNDFTYKKEKDGGYFNPRMKSVVVSDTTISTLNHETGHALHFFLTDYKLPEQYESIISRIASSEDWMKKLEEYAKNAERIKEEAKKNAREIITRYISLEAAQTNTEEINSLLQSTKEEQKRKYIEKGYSEETLDLIFSSTFTLEEFIKQKREVEQAEMVDVIMRYEYDAFTAISDILDAITYGKFRSGLLSTEQNETINPFYGHGIRYYTRDALSGFQEMIANYETIIKSKKSKEMIDLLRYYVGDELVNMLEEFYTVEMLNIHSYETERNETL